MFLSGGAGLSVQQQIIPFSQMFLNQGSYKGKQILGKKTIELVYINQNSHIPDSIFWTNFWLSV